MTEIVPASAQEAEAQLAQLGPLATSIEWERACLVWALSQPGSAGRPAWKSAKNSRLSFSRFAAKGIFGLTHHSSVARYWHYWQRAIDAGIATEVKLGDHVKLPQVPFSDYAPEKPDTAEAVTEAIGADPRAVARQAWAELKEQHELEEERNQALRDEAYELEVLHTLATLVIEEGKDMTRPEADKFVRDQVAEKRRPFIEAADRKAKQDEVRKVVKLADKIEAIVNGFVAAVADDSELLRVRESEELQGIQEVLDRVMTSIGTLQVNRAVTLLDEEKS